MELTPLTNALSGLGPWGIALGIALTILGPKILARIKPLLPAPSPAKPDAAPNAEPAPSSTPLMDAAMQVLRALARRKFGYLPTEEAMHKYVGELAKADEDEAVKKASEAVKSRAGF